MESSRKLQEFYNELQAWVNSGFKPHPVFKLSDGLCWNLDNLLYPHIRDMTDEEFNACEALKVELSNQFLDAGLNRTYPFNNGDCRSYDQEYESGTLWTNSKRLAWVKEHANVTETPRVL